MKYITRLLLVALILALAACYPDDETPTSTPVSPPVTPSSPIPTPHILQSAPALRSQGPEADTVVVITIDYDPTAVTILLNINPDPPKE